MMNQTTDRNKKDTDKQPTNNVELRTEKKKININEAQRNQC